MEPRRLSGQIRVLYHLPCPHDALLAEDTSWFLTSGRTEGLSVPNITTSDRINGG